MQTSECGGDRHGRRTAQVLGAGVEHRRHVDGVNDPNVRLFAIDYNHDGYDDLALYYPR